MSCAAAAILSSGAFRRQSAPAPFPGDRVQVICKARVSVGACKYDFMGLRSDRAPSWPAGAKWPSCGWNNTRCLHSQHVAATALWYMCRADSRFASSQWQTVLICNDVSHWLGTSLESALCVGCANQWTHINSLGPERCDNYSKSKFLNSFYSTVALEVAMNLLSGEYHITSMMRSQHWFR